MRKMLVFRHARSKRSSPQPKPPTSPAQTQPCWSAIQAKTQPSKSSSTPDQTGRLLTYSHPAKSSAETLNTTSLIYPTRQSGPAHRKSECGLATLKRDPHFSMVGVIVQTPNRLRLWRKPLSERKHQRHYELAHRLHLKDHAKVAPPAAAPDVQPADNVPIVVDGARAHVTVTLGSINATMLIDTGATLASVNFWTAQALLAERRSPQRRRNRRRLKPSGQTVTDKQIVINQITIGNHTIPNVVAAVNTNEGDMLLPFPVLNQIGKFTIDTANHKLIFGGDPPCGPSPCRCSGAGFR